MLSLKINYIFFSKKLKREIRIINLYYKLVIWVILKLEVNNILFFIKILSIKYSIIYLKKKYLYIN